MTIINEILLWIKSNWWLVTGGCSLIIFAYKVLMEFLTYKQLGMEYLDRQENRRFWRQLGAAAFVAWIINQFLSAPIQTKKSSSKLHEKELK